MSSLIDILTPSRVRGIISRIRTPGSTISRHMGMEIGGKNVTQVQGDIYTYDIYDNVRRVARGTLRGSPATTVAANPVGNNTVRLARSAEKLPMDYNRLMALRKLGEPAGFEDRLGAIYVNKQAETLRQVQDNFREAVVGALFNGGVYYLVQSGQSLYPTYSSSGTLYGVDLQIPSANKLSGGSFAAGLQMETGSNIIDTAWSDPAADIIGHLTKISRAFQQIVGAPLAKVYTDVDTWNYVLQNTAIRQRAGTAHQPFASYELVQDRAPDGTLTGLFMGKIIGMPWLTWYMYDGGINLGTSETYTRILPDSYCTFMIDMGTGMQAVEGSEIVKENDLAAPKEVRGFHAWVMEKADPARFELHTLQTFGIELNTPKGIAWARVR